MSNVRPHSRTKPPGRLLRGFNTSAEWTRHPTLVRLAARKEQHMKGAYVHIHMVYLISRTLFSRQSLKNKLASYVPGFQLFSGDCGSGRQGKTSTRMSTQATPAAGGEGGCRLEAPADLLPHPARLRPGRGPPRRLPPSVSFRFEIPETSIGGPDES